MHPQIPPEILRNIFRLATFTTTSLNVMDWDPHWPYAWASEKADPTLSYESTLPTKKALTLVSRSFRDLSLEFLFELVQLFHTRNAQLLLDMILSQTTGTGKRPAKWIKYIMVDLDKDDDSRLMDGVLKKIFPHCENLAAFGYDSKERMRDPWNDVDSSDLMASIPLSITTLEWHRDSLGNSLNSLQSHTALRNLRVSGFLVHDNHVVALPFITHLYLQPPFTIPASPWGLPSISHLRMDAFFAVDRFLAESESKDTIRSLYIADSRTRLGGFPQLLASLPKLGTFSYDFNIGLQVLLPSSSWLGAARHASLSHIYLFCNGGVNRSFSTIRDGFSDHLQPLMALHLPLTIGIMHAHLLFEHGDFREGGYGAADKQRFFDDLSSSLSSSEVRVIVK
ncbi:hypothetical protein BD410DRAFT_371922 [Rickenella mellea]|uniref:F-box domain-containing protein n=1 Tax=Rickenella mellea TaxID=50990 RepID=A0A4Y7PZ70_9AGAM|nr:hypothetical protein BD410DRAFT_371922 [Rickenella mellea]